MSEDTIHDERWRRFMARQRRAFACPSPEGRERLIKKQVVMPMGMCNLLASRGK